jgi:curved DNA-binding protein CbpA
MKNPFDVLGVPETTDDEAIKKAYLQKVREHPPEREPERFQIIRTAFETIKTRRDRLSYRLFHQETPDIEGLVESALRPRLGKRPSEKQLLQGLTDNLISRKP